MQAEGCLDIAFLGGRPAGKQILQIKRARQGWHANVVSGKPRQPEQTRGLGGQGIRSVKEACRQTRIMGTYVGCKARSYERLGLQQESQSDREGRQAFLRGRVRPTSSRPLRKSDATGRNMVFMGNIPRRHVQNGVHVSVYVYYTSQNKS